MGRKRKTPELTPIKPNLDHSRDPYPYEFRVNAARLVAEEGRSQAAVARWLYWEPRDADALFHGEAAPSGPDQRPAARRSRRGEAPEP